MKLVAISPEADEPREYAVLASLFAAGLERYHVRKPQWSRAKLAAWLGDIPGRWRLRMVVHQHHGLAEEFGCGGVHFKDTAEAASQWRSAGSEGSQVRGAHASRVLLSASRRERFGWLGRDAQADTRDACAPRTWNTGIGCCNASGIGPRIFTSRSCHDLETLRGALGHFDAVFFSPVFASISKPGYQPKVAHTELSAMLQARTEAQRQTEIIALGGISPANAGRCVELGFDGVALLGSLWGAADPLKVFDALQQSLAAHVA
jgi:thiamine-phosphate pyrophosphorylase